MADDKPKEKKEKMFVLVGKNAVSVNEKIYRRGDEIPESEYAELPKRVQAFFEPEGKKKAKK